jgi:hypothetical protein
MSTRQKEILFKIGDSVQVREGMLCPDDEPVDISGWQGRIFEIDDNLVGIRWDSITLEQLPLEYIKASEAEDLAWTEIHLSDLNPFYVPASIRELSTFSVVYC